ncbi:MAG: TPM domain-containing protein [Balneola sp.]
MGELMRNNYQSSIFAKNPAKQILKQPSFWDIESGDCFLEKVKRASFKTRLLAKTAFIVGLFFILISPVAAQNFDFLPDRPTGMVNDYADMLTSSEEQRLERKLINYRDTTTNVIAIAILQSLEGNSVEEVGTELFNTWRMWEGDRYNGVLILISESDRKIRIEVGYGLEGAIPDVMANRIINDIITPSFRNQDVYSGLDRATSALIQLASGEFEGSPEGLVRSQGDEGFPVDVFIIIIVIIIFIATKGGRGGRGNRKRTFGPEDVVEALFWSQVFGGGRSRGGGSGFGGGGGFGGFSGGGGFGSGGGGASGGW